MWRIYRVKESYHCATTTHKKPYPVCFLLVLLYDGGPAKLMPGFYMVLIYSEGL